MSESLFDLTVECSTLVELLCWRALHQPDRRAYTFLADGETEEVSLTYGELDRQARAIGALLQSLGATGERVLLLYHPGLEYIAAFFGCLYAGGIAVPSYPPRLNRPDPRLQAIVADAQATVALTTPHILSNVERRFAHTPGLEALRWLSTDKVASDLADAWRDPAVEGDTLAFLQYTSGSTATPKGVMVSHGNILHNERMIQQAFGQTERSTVVGWLPIYHDMGLIGNVLQPLYVGAHCILMSPLDFLQKPFCWLKAISHYKAHTSGGPNFAYDLCVDKITPEQRTTLDLSSWEVAFSGAEPVRHQTMRRFAEAFEPCGFHWEAFYPCYGLAEATLFVSGGLKSAPPVLYPVQGSALERDCVVATVDEDEDSRTLAGCGRTWADQEIVIVNPETLTRCPPNRVGEIWVSGANVAQGYWNQAEETEHTFQAYLADTGEGPFLRTGDLGFLREGELFITGRIKDLIIIRGHNHYPQDIELTVEESHSALQPGCGAAFSVEVDDEERLVVVQELKRAHRKADVEKVAQAIRQAVAEEHELQVYAVALVKPMSIPKTSSDKIQRRACRAKFLDGSLEVIGVSILDDVTSSPSADTLTRDTLLAEALLALEPQQRHLLLERHLQQQVAHLLRVAPSRVDPQQPLSALGLDSLMAVELQHSLETGLGVVLPMASFLESPSIARLAVHIADQLMRSESLQTLSIPHVSRDGGLPLSFAQQRLWFLNQLEPGNPAYHIPVAVRLCGALDVAALARSVNEIVRRHESLRTTFAETNGRPIQVIAPAVSITVPMVDLYGLPEAAREAETQRWITEEAQRPFDLAKGPLLRVPLLRLDEREHVLVLVMHHIVSDGWSMGVFGRELAVLYQAFSARKPSPLPELPIQYVDFAHWQQHWLDSVLETQISYWKQQLGPDLPALDLPTERPRSAIRTFRGIRQSLMLPKTLTEALKALGQQEGCTLFMTLLAAFKIILQRYSRQDDVVVGSPVAGRSRAEARDLIGFFLNTLVLRTDLSGNPTFLELLHRVREVALGAYANQDLPFERLLKELQPQRDLSRTPLFQIFFNMLNLPGKEIELPGLTAEVLSPLEVVSLFDLTLYAEEQDGGIKLDLVYNADLFGQAQMTEMLKQLEHLLLQIVEKPGESIARYALVTAAEALPNPAGSLSSDWGGAVHALFSQQARRVPGHLAVVDKRGAWTYKELDACSNQLANYLRAHGIQSQDVVAVYSHRSASLVWAVLGVLKAGAAFTVLDPAYPASRLIDYLEVAKPRGWLQIEAAGRLPDALEEFVARLPNPCRLELPPRVTDAAILEGYSMGDPGATVGPDDLAVVGFTSGSTGRPKGILGRHGPLSHFLPWQKETFGLRSSDRYSMLSGLSHDPLQRDIFTSLCLGATLCIPDPKDMDTPGRLAEWMRQETISIAHLTPAMLQLLTQTVTGGTEPVQEIPSLRYAFTVGDVLTRQDISRFQKLAPGVTCVCFYGSTETQRAVGCFVPGDGSMVSRETIPLGKGIPDVQLLVLNVSQELAGIGETGEIYVRSPHLAKGYLGDEALTRERFLINPFTKANGDRLYRTGDLGRYLPDGNVEFLGRADHQVKIRGFRIELGEIEAVLGQHPAVRETVVLAREDVLGDPSVTLGVGKRLVAYVVPSPGQAPMVGELRRFLKEKLPDYMVPSAFVFLESLPLTPNRKVDRRALPAPDMTKVEREGDFVAPRTPTEEMLAGIWTHVLDLKRVSVQDSFFDLGGHSLLATQVISRVRDVFQVELPVRRLFETPTVAGLAEAIERARQAEQGLQAPPMLSVSRDKELPLSFAQQRLWFLCQFDPDLPLYNVFFAAHLSGPLDVPALERSFGEIVRRHQVLRTTFVAVAGQPVQVIVPALALPLPIVDIQELPEARREIEIQRLATEEARRHFDLAQGPLVRTTLLRLGQEEHVLLLSIHHIITDGWSMGIFVREMAAIYEAFSDGRPSPLPELSIQYADFAHWQRQWLQGEILETQLAYWKRQLGDAPPLLELPTDHPRPAIQTFRGAREHLVLPKSLIGDLKALSQQEGVTLFMTLLAAFKVLLYRYANQEDILVGTPIANRSRVEIEGLVGFFANTLVLRTDLSGNPTFRELLRRVRQVALEAYAHQDLPFEKLVEELQPERDLSHNPMFQIMFILQTAPASFAEFPNLDVRYLEVGTGTAKFDMMLELRESSEGLWGWLEYNVDLFEAATVRKMFDRFHILLEDIASNPDGNISTLSITREREIEHLISGFNVDLGS